MKSETSSTYKTAWISARATLPSGLHADLSLDLIQCATANVDNAAVANAINTNNAVAIANANNAVGGNVSAAAEASLYTLHRGIRMFHRGFWRFALLTAYAWLALSAPATAQNADSDLTKVDNDGDGLIEIYTLSDLNNIRYDLRGTSYRTSDSDPGDARGCPMGGDDEDDSTPEIELCHGYELMNDLDFDTNGNGRADSEDAYYNGGAGWQPIGTFIQLPFTVTFIESPFTATFDGNGYAIANLFIDRDSERSVGLFGFIGRGGAIRNLGLVDATVSGGEFEVGGLVGQNRGIIIASYAVATVAGTSEVGGLAGTNFGTITASYAVATVTGTSEVGGLAGRNIGIIAASYAVATVSGDDNVGGLVGVNDDGTIDASYAVATVTVTVVNVGGLVGQNDSGDITSSYFDMTVSGLTEPSDQAQSTAALQMPTEAEGYIGIYRQWNVDIDGDDTADDPWYFNDSMSYPGLSLPQITSGDFAGRRCPSAPASFPITLPQSFPAGLLESFTITPIRGRCVHLFGDPPTLRLKLRVFLESALP